MDHRDPTGAPALPGYEELLRLNREGELHRVSLERHMVIADKRLELTHRIGAGGFGQVWEAWHIDLEKKRAIKFLDGQHRDPAAVRARFRAEAQLLSQLEGEHLVRVLDYGELPDEVPYFVMELVQGPTLRERMAKPLSVLRAVEIADQLLQGLHDVHERGLTHGDVKPENTILSGPEEKVRVIDFGLAQITALATDAAGGTPPYMAPELVLDGEPASRQSDVYAVGVVLYEMLTGELPRGHGSMGIEQIQRSWEMKPAATPMRVLRKDVPVALDELVLKVLSRDPSVRPGTAREMYEALQVFAAQMAEGLADTVQPAGSRPPTSATADTEPMPPKAPTIERRRGPRALSIGGALAVLVGLGWHYWPEQPAPHEELAAPASFDASTFVAAKDGILVVAADGADATIVAAYEALCSGLRGDPPTGKGLLCKRLSAAAVDSDAIVAAADEAGARVVILVGEQIVVRSTSHDHGSPLVARVDGLPLPKESNLRQVAIVIRAVVDPIGSDRVEIPVLTLQEWDARWVVLAELLRSRSGQVDEEATVRLEELERALDVPTIPPFYRDLAKLLRAQASTCNVGASTLTELSAPGMHELGIRIQALLGLAACLVDGKPLRPDQVEKAEILVEQAIEASEGNPCVRVAALGTLARIDGWRGDDALWKEHLVALPREDRCGDPSMWSKVLSVRGDSLVAARRWCDAEQMHEQAYGALASRAVPLLAWAETSWMCKPDRRADRAGLLEALDRARESKRFKVAERVSIAYLRWWLTNDFVDAQHVSALYAEVELGTAALLDGVGSELVQELCDDIQDPNCSLTILTGPKQLGDEDRLRAALGLSR